MGDLITETPVTPVLTKPQELVPPMQPGVDHPDHTKVMRQNISEQSGVKEADVVPESEQADNLAAEAVAQFASKPENVVKPASVKDDESEGAADFKENMALLNFDEAASKVRTAPVDLVKRIIEEKELKEAA